MGLDVDDTNADGSDSDEAEGSQNLRGLTSSRSRVCSGTADSPADVVAAASTQIYDHLYGELKMRYR